MIKLKNLLLILTTFCIFSTTSNLSAPKLPKLIFLVTTFLLADQAKAHQALSEDKCYPIKQSKSEILTKFNDCKLTGNCKEIRPDVAACLTKDADCSRDHLALLDCAQNHLCEPFLEIISLDKKLSELSSLYSKLGFLESVVFGAKRRCLCSQNSLIGAEFMELFNQNKTLTAEIFRRRHDFCMMITFSHVTNISELAEEFILLHELAHHTLGDLLSAEDALDRLSLFAPKKLPTTTGLLVDAKTFSLENPESTKHIAEFFYGSNYQLSKSNKDHFDEYCADGLAIIGLYLKYKKIDFEPLFEELMQIFSPTASILHPCREARINFMRQVLSSLKKESAQNS